MIALLVLDLVGFFPGALLASVVAAAVVLATDARGLMTLNGLIKWKRMTLRLQVLTFLLGLALFQLLVAAYLVQRLYGVVRDAFGWAAVEPPSQTSRPSEHATTATAEAPLSADAIQRALDNLLAEAGGRLPPQLQDKVRSVASAVGDVLPAYRASGLAAQDRFVVERTAVDYLPSAVRSYLKLPVAYRSLPLQEAGGKTADKVLSDQLDLLIDRLDQVVDEAYRKDLEALIVHGRFLHSKFGRSDLSISS